MAVPRREEDRLGERIRRYRDDKGLKLSELAAVAEISKSYLWSLENAPSPPRPSADVLYRIAQALGVTMSELLGRRLLLDPPEELPDSLVEFAAERNLPDSDIRMLANIRFRGEAPKTKQRWAHIYDAIRTSELLEGERRSERRRK
jgi:transcriptional regulator with XRE-family HTH domain